MEMDKRTFLIAFTIILVLGVVFFNFEKFTGQATRPIEESKVYVSSSEYIKSEPNLMLKAGETVYVTVDVGSEGIYRNLRIADNNRGGAITGGPEVELNSDSIQGCGGNRCSAPRPGETKLVTGSYKTWNSWEGEYCAMVYDLAVEDHIGTCFTVY